jgi:hypothetical protein
LSVAPSASGSAALQTTSSLLDAIVLIGSKRCGATLSCLKTSASVFLARAESHAGSTK